MQGTSVNCSKVALACNGTLLVGLASDGVDPQSNILQVKNLHHSKERFDILFRFGMSIRVNLFN